MAMKDDLPEHLSDFDKDCIIHIKLLSEALDNVLQKAGVLNADTSRTGTELLLAAEEFCKQ